MKRILSILLAITLLIASGCGSTSGNNEQPDNTQTNNTQNDNNTDVTPPDESGEENTDEPSDSGEETPDIGNLGDSDYNPTTTGWKKGETIADFTVTTFDGKEVTLSDVLREKDAVLINVFATWCGPCKSEFPFMESTYKQMKDKVEIIAISGDSTDTNEMIRQVATSLGLTFPMAQDTAGISRGIKLTAYPTTLVVDRFGTIVFSQIGSFPDESSFTRLFDFLVSEEYTESVVLNELPPVMPHLDKLSSEELSAALSDGSIVFENVPGQYNWPMALAEVDGRSALVSTNKGTDESRCVVQTTITAVAGDVFAFDLKLSSESGFDFFTLTVNGEIVKVFSGEKDWSTYAYEFAADGEYLIELAFVKDQYTGAGEDSLWLDNARILSGDEAAAALAANPSYPTAAETSFTFTNKDATRVYFEDPYNIIYKIFGCEYEAYLLNALEVNCVFTLSEGVDPDASICFNNKDVRYVLSSIVSGKNYSVTYEVESLGTTGKAYTSVVLDPNVNVDGDERPIFFFADVEGLEKFVKSFAAKAWYTEDEWNAMQSEKEQEPLGDVVYTLRCVDENGARIAGVTLQVCNASTCSIYTTDANGECVLTLPSDNYEIHILKAPEGYTFDSENVITAPLEGGEITFSLTRA